MVYYNILCCSDLESCFLRRSKVIFIGDGRDAMKYALLRDTITDPGVTIVSSLNSFNKDRINILRASNNKIFNLQMLMVLQKIRSQSIYV